MSTLQSSAPARAVTPTPSEPPRTGRSLAWHRWISPLAVVVIWQLASSTGLLAEDELASPWRVVVAAVDVTASGELPEGLLVSLVRVVIGLALGVSVGAALGLVAGLSRWGGNARRPAGADAAHAAAVRRWCRCSSSGSASARRRRSCSSPSASLFPLYLNLARGAARRRPRSCSRPRASSGSRAPSSCATSCCPARCPARSSGCASRWASPGSRSIVAEQVNADAGLGYMINNARDFLRTDVDRRRPARLRRARAGHRRARAPARAARAALAGRTA